MKFIARALVARHGADDKAREMLLEHPPPFSRTLYAAGEEEASRDVGACIITEPHFICKTDSVYICTAKTSIFLRSRIVDSLKGWAGKWRWEIDPSGASTSLPPTSRIRSMEIRINVFINKFISSRQIRTGVIQLSRWWGVRSRARKKKFQFKCSSRNA